jgi:hypothetical protein
MVKVDGLALYKEVKLGRKSLFDEEKHCSMILNIMGNYLKGTPSAFCVEACIGESTFYDWLKNHEIFRNCYSLGKMLARENWEAHGREVCEEVTMPGTSSHKFEYWRMIGWSRFGVGKNSRIRLDLDANGTPSEHYGQLLKQAANGDFTSGEIKQLMEAVNVGLSTHQVFTLQKEIDQLKFDLTVMTENNNVHNTFADKRPQKKD